MNTIPARSVEPGMTIKTPGTAEAPPVTLTVTDGNWSDADYAEPADPQNPTHVVLAEMTASPPWTTSAEVCLPVDALVTVITQA